MIGGVVLFVVEMVFDVVSGGGGAVLRVDLDEELLLFFVEFGGNDLELVVLVVLFVVGGGGGAVLRELLVVTLVIFVVGFGGDLVELVDEVVGGGGGGFVVLADLLVLDVVLMLELVGFLVDVGRGGFTVPGGVPNVKPGSVPVLVKSVPMVKPGGSVTPGGRVKPGGSVKGSPRVAPPVMTDTLLVDRFGIRICGRQSATALSRAVTANNW